MNCQQLRQDILNSENVDAFLASAPGHSAHLCDCEQCRVVVARLRRLETIARILKVRGAAERPSPDFYARLPVLASDRPGRAGCLRRTFHGALAASLILTASILAIAVAFNSSSARAQGVMQRLVDWNLELAGSHDPALRQKLYRAHCDEFRQMAQHARLSDQDRQLADELLENARVLAAEDDAVSDTRQLLRLADQILLRRNAEGDRAEAAQFDQLYHEVVTHGVDVSAARVAPDQLTPAQAAEWRALEKQAGERLSNTQPSPPTSRAAVPVPTTGAAAPAGPGAPALNMADASAPASLWTADASRGRAMTGVAPPAAAIVATNPAASDSSSSSTTDTTGAPASADYTAPSENYAGPTAGDGCGYADCPVASDPSANSGTEFPSSSSSSSPVASGDHRGRIRMTSGDASLSGALVRRLQTSVANAGSGARVAAGDQDAWPAGGFPTITSVSAGGGASPASALTGDGTSADQTTDGGGADATDLVVGDAASGRVAGLPPAWLGTLQQAQMPVSVVPPSGAEGDGTTATGTFVPVMPPLSQMPLVPPGAWRRSDTPSADLLARGSGSINSVQEAPEPSTVFILLAGIALLLGRTSRRSTLRRRRP